MTRTEIINKINEVEDKINYEECADRGYRFDVVRELKAELKALNEELKKLD